MRVLTREGALAQFGREDDGSEVSDEILRITAVQRHESRVAATLEAVAQKTPDKRAQIAILLGDLLGAWGSGPLGLGNALGEGATERVFLSGLGSSRWQATDGGAWHGAGIRALYELCGGNYSHLEVTPDVDFEGVLFEGLERIGVVDLDLRSCQIKLPVPWASVLVRLGVWISVREGRQWLMKGREFTLDFKGEASDWAHLLMLQVELENSWSPSTVPGQT